MWKSSGGRCRSFLLTTLTLASSWTTNEFGGTLVVQEDANVKVVSKKERPRPLEDFHI